MKTCVIPVVTLALTLFISNRQVLAQMADVPRFDGNGDFQSTQVQGNRGRYPHRQWLVIDTDPNGLNCRDASGMAVVTLAYGAVANSAFGSSGIEAIELRDGQPWLRVEVSGLDVQRRVTDEVADIYTCYIRANTDYIAPINPDSQADRL